ncbi:MULTISPECIES: phenylalanine--tRNA ligase subunit beta [Paraclostridium]|uniref:phenylalanine--tRNA ligase subunit beta n=1 Tax=Paraclostridium TaxID=1849822 RepID=UPI00038D4695|nr:MULTISPECIES: phenylalanine--tRNA ligase subunit beta [Paraclostridium]EQK48149.1 phenylalanine--tRNA ligase, beta subunit [[Clostridium] bifermentans ATCC 19299] [Paraclostridium bifermentans ATCC 19299]MBZ6005817.1 phenylalanine--tRNA ligase subunit beta [Paraclostridium bifermentans]MDU0295355.1 phenylalanine--tRNA ligase subunit beta [Paraclostridium sp. MRS3W1]MDU0295458.1 phenylalanine--tRNA ligase subunit beta [Paraclostridium sp. MRS3W1]TQO57237.1 phenylalanine--tRNA ligase subunit 
MLVPLKWLRDYVDIDRETQEFADMMTMTGSKVEKVEFFGKETNGVEVCKILEIEQHPDADRLKVTKVEVADGQILQIVTNATNINVGDYVPVARIGAVLPGDFKIKKGKLRGVLSEGMFCGAEELTIPSQYVEEHKKDGIYILDHQDSFELGMDVREALGINDALIEFEITSNRPDCRSIIGIAREAAVTLGKELKYPQITVNGSDEEMKFEIDVQTELCKRYCGKVIKDVKVGPSPYWMQRRLIEAGMRPINNIVDITNYVMLELGQPLHAFDLEDIKYDKMIVKLAQEGEKFTTLDGVQRTLTSDMLVIGNQDKTLDLAGIMGGENSEVKDNTTSIFLEGASFAKENIRATSKKLGLRTEASSRFEKGIDVNLTEAAVNRACQLIEELGCGTVLNGMLDYYPKKEEVQKITANPERINKLLGVNVPMDQFINILERLEFKCNLISSDKLELEVPSFRLDICEDADILEEVARIYGYENIPSATLEGNATAGVKTNKQKFMDNVKSNSIAVGLNEILTYSFVSPRGVDKLNLAEDDERREFVKIINPLGEETSVMRTTLIPNMLDVISTNLSHKVEEVYAFECGNTFRPQEGLPVETKKLSIGMYGKEVDFFSIKGAVETILTNVGFDGYEVEPETKNLTFHPGRCAKLVYNNICIGTFGELHPDVLENYDLNQRVYVAEIDIDLVFENLNNSKVYNPLPKYPATTRDIALLVKDEVFVKQIEDIIKANGSDILESYQLFDVYKGAQIEEGHKSIAYSITYRSKDKTLTDEDVAKVHDKIVSELSEKLNANLRSN